MLSVTVSGLQLIVATSFPLTVTYIPYDDSSPSLSALLNTSKVLSLITGDSGMKKTELDLSGIVRAVKEYSNRQKQQSRFMNLI